MNIKLEKQDVKYLIGIIAGITVMAVMEYGMWVMFEMMFKGYGWVVIIVMNVGFVLMVLQIMGYFDREEKKNEC